jgi:hypothetical protein
MSKPLTFKELEEGAKFISFPLDGDDSGHGGYRRGEYVYTKLSMYSRADQEIAVEGPNAVRNADGMLRRMLPHEKVLLVL